MRLDQISPELVRDQVLEQILGHLQTYAIPLSTPGEPSGVRLPTLDEARRSTLGFQIAAVAHYGRTGEWILPGEAESPAAHHALASDALTQVVCALYGSPVGEAPVPVDADADPETPWGVVLAACIGRQALATGEAISAVQLATLAGVSVQRVHQLAQAGELDRARHGGVRAASARRWLSARGVAGYGRRP